MASSTSAVVMLWITCYIHIHQCSSSEILVVVVLLLMCHMWNGMPYRHSMSYVLGNITTVTKAVYTSNNNDEFQP